MADYTGELCLHCQQPFQTEDDVVVCPDCGTPYHRECWMENGCCINLALHETGEGWKKSAPEPAAEGEVLEGKERICPRCGSSCMSSQRFCNHCGMVFLSDYEEEPAAQDMDICCGLSPEERYDGERLQDIADFVENNTIYYIPVFKKFRETGTKLSLNFISAIFPQFYFANRKMWGACILVILLFLLLDVPAHLLVFVTDNAAFTENVPYVGSADPYQAMTHFMQQKMQRFGDILQPHQLLLERLQLICRYFKLVARVLFLTFSNYLYYKFVLKNVKRIRAEGLPESMQRDRLRMRGGTNMWYVPLAVLVQYGVLVLFSMGLVFLMLMLK